jgi:putative spermidine/putrescine transport system permease protein
VHIYVPFMVLTLVGVIGRIDERLEEAARGLGAGRLRAFLEVTLPLSLPGILAGSLLVFRARDQRLRDAVLLGGNNVLTLPMLIYQQVERELQPRVCRRARSCAARRLLGTGRSPTIACWAVSPGERQMSA